MASAVATCPACGTPVSWPWPPACSSCGVQLAGPEAHRLAEVDRELAALWEEREQLLARLRPMRLPQPPPARDESDPREVSDREGWRLTEASAQTLLAGAGVASLVVAAVVFAAVTWKDLGAGPRAFVLLAASGGSAVATRVLVQRGLASTGEAVAVLTIAFGLICVHGAHAFGLLGLQAVPLALYVACAYAGLVVGAHALGAWSGTRAPGLLAGMLVLVAGPAAVIHLRGVVALERPLVDALALLAVTLLTMAYARAAAGPAARGLTTGGAALLWGAAGVAALVVVTDVSVAAGVATVAVVAAAAAAASMLGGPWLSVGPAGASLALTVGMVVALSSSGLDAVLAAALTWTVAAAALVAVPAGRPRASVLVGAGAVGLLAATGALQAARALIEAAASVTRDPWSATGPLPLAWPDVAVTLLLGAALAGALATYRRWSAAVAAGIAGLVLAGAGAVQAAALAPAVQAVLGLVVAGTMTLLVTLYGRRWALIAGLGGAAWTLAWALAEPWTTVTALAALAVLAALPATRTALVRSDRLVAVGLAVAGAVAIPPTVVAAAGGTAAAAGVVAVVVAAVTVLAVDAVVATGRGGLLGGGEVSGALAVASGLALAAADPPVLAIAFAVAGLAAGAHSLRPDRRWSSVLSGALLSACSWTLLADAEVAVVEAYTALPAAAALLIGGWRLAVDTRAQSLPALGPGMSLALAPTTLLVLADPGDLVRVLALATLAALVAAVGASLRLVAPVVYGVVALTLVALTQVSVAATHLPRWVTFAALGVALVAFSATYERQLRRVRSTRQRLALLR